jgi:RNA polymerase sigma-70 factor (ECF subfamily)
MIFGVRKYRKYSDDDLVAAYFHKPSRDILQVLYERYGHLVLGLCIKYLKHVENAEDLCATIFEKLPQLLVKHDIRYFKSWLYQVSRNECLMVLRKNGHHTITVEDFQLESDQSNETESIENKILALEDALKELKPRQRECVTLFYITEMSYTAISAQLNMKVKTVKSNIQNGKRNLKIKLERNHE